MSSQNNFCGLLCNCWCHCIFAWVLPIIFIWLAFRILTPTCSIIEFDVFALQNAATNQTIHYDLKLKNRNFNKGIYYDALNLTFYYKPNRTFPIAETTISPFYQGYGKTAHRVGDIEPTGVKLSNASAANGVAVFRVEMETKVRYKSPLWKTRRHHLMIGADLQVNDQGRLVEGTKLRSGAARNMGWSKLVGILGVLIFILV